MRPTRVFPVTAVVVAGLIGPAAGHAYAGGGGGGNVCDGFSQGDEVSMLDSCYAGTAQLVDPDAAVLNIRNQGEFPHTFTATDGSFDLYLDPGETGTVDIPDSLVTPVYCTLHGTSSGQGMSGVIVRAGADVVGASATRIPSPQPEGALDTDQTSASADDNGDDSLSIIALAVASAAAALSVATTGHLVVSRRQSDAGR